MKEIAASIADPQKRVEAEKEADDAILRSKERLADQEERLDLRIAQSQLRTVNMVTNIVEEGFDRTIQGMLRGEMSFSQGMGRMFGNLVEQAATAWIHMAIQHEAMEIRRALATQTANTQITLSNAQAAAESQDISLMTALKQLAASAASSAGKAYNAVVGIPIVGPVLAPIAAAGAYVAVMGFGGMASAAGGWDQVPNDQLAMVHKNEMVLPASLAGGIRNMISAGATTNNSPQTTIYQHFGGNTYNGPRGSARGDRMTAAKMRRATMRALEAVR